MALLSAFTMLFTVSVSAQQSPGAKDSVAINGKNIVVKYSSPSVRGRDIFSATGLLSKDGTYPIWRAGANAATLFHTDADLMIGALHVPKGDYSLYVNVQNPDNWELVINKQTGQGGTTYKPEMDLGRVKMNMSKPSAIVESLYYKITPTGANNGTIRLAWENRIGEVNFMVH